jgi:hypothetical protein
LPVELEVEVVTSPPGGSGWGLNVQPTAKAPPRVKNVARRRKVRMGDLGPNG